MSLQMSLLEHDPTPIARRDDLETAIRILWRQQQDHLARHRTCLRCHGRGWTTTPYGRDLCNGRPL